MSAQSAATEAFQSALRDDDPEALYEKAPCGYLSTGPEGTLVKANATFLLWTGYTSDELLGRRRFSDLLTTGGRVYLESHLRPMLHMQGEVREIALDLVRADGSRFPVVINAVLERTPDGKPGLTRVAMFDATERRSYERELLAAKRRAEDSEAQAVRLARTLQETLIPPQHPTVPGLDVAAEYRPAGRGDEVGGDFYDVFQLGEGDWAVVLGDVSGKGVEAAVVTSLVRHTIRALAVQEPAPGTVLQRLNDVLIASDTERFCTVVLLRLREGTGSWRVTSASGGHPLPVLLDGSESLQVIGEPGSLVGVFEDTEFDEAVTVLSPGQRIFLYTDGVTEARWEQEFFGDDRLVDALLRADGGPVELVRSVLAEVLDFQHQLPRDDIAVLALGMPR